MGTTLIVFVSDSIAVANDLPAGAKPVVCVCPNKFETVTVSENTQPVEKFYHEVSTVFDTVTVADSLQNPPVIHYKPLYPSPVYSSNSLVVPVAGTFKLFYPTYQLDGLGSKIKIEIWHGSGVTITLDNVFIGYQTAVDVSEPSDAVTLSRVTFDNGSSTASIPSGTTKVSDEITLPTVPAGAALVLSVHSTTSVRMVSVAGDPVRQGVLYKAAVDEAGTADVDYASYTASSGAYVFLRGIYVTDTPIDVPDGFDSFIVARPSPAVGSGESQLYGPSNWRTVIPSSLILKAASYFRVAIPLALGMAVLHIDGASVGHVAASGDAWDYDGTQVRLTFGGSNSIEFGKYSLALSDPVYYEIDPSRNLVVHVYSNSSADDAIPSIPYPGCNTYYGGTSNDYTLTNDPSLVAYGSNNTITGFIIDIGPATQKYESVVLIESAIVEVEAAATGDLTVNKYESVSISEDIDSRNHIDNLSSFDNVAVAEQLYFDGLLIISISDVTTVADVAILSFISYITDLYDSTIISESATVFVEEATLDLTVSKFDTATIAEAAISSVSDVVTAVSDTVTATEYSVVTVSGPAVSIFDTSSVSESATVELIGGIVSISIYDTVGVAENYTLCRENNVSKSESVTVTESVSRTFVNLFIDKSETVTVFEFYALRNYLTLFLESDSLSSYAAGGRNERTILPSSAFPSVPFTVNQIRAQIEVSSVGGTIAGASIGPHSADGDYADPYFRLQYNNTNSWGSFTGTRWSDWEDYSGYASDVDIAVHVFLSMGDLKVSATCTHAGAYSSTYGVDESQTRDISGLGYYTYDSTHNSGVKQVDVAGYGSYQYGGSLSISVVDVVSVTENITRSIDLAGISVYDTVTVEEYVTVSFTFSADISVIDTVSVVEYVVATVSDLGVGTVEIVSVQELGAAALSAFELSVAEVTLLSEATISTVSAPSLLVYDVVSVVDNAVVYREVPGEFEAQDSVSVVDVAVTRVEDPAVSIFDSVTLSEQSVTVIGLQLSVSDSITVTEFLANVPPVVNAFARDSVVVSEWAIFVPDIVIILNEVISVTEYETHFVTSFISQHDSITVTDTRDISLLLLLNLIESILIEEYTNLSNSDPQISVVQDVTIADYGKPYWLSAAGILVLDADIIVPILDTDILAPDIEGSIVKPELDPSILHPEVSAFVMLPNMEFEVT
jgi:hypothetical protein